MAFINLFFVPAISVYILFALSKQPIKLNAKLVLTYMICTAVVAFCTKFIMILIKYLFAFDRTNLGGICYFLASFVVAIIVPFIASAFKVKTKEN